jgi:hypothetical protein
MAERLVYYTLQPDRETGGIDWKHEEFARCYTTLEAARIAGDVALAKVLDIVRAKVYAWRPEADMSVARRAWEKEGKSACFVETRLTTSPVAWEDASTQGRTWRREEWRGTLTIGRESRHRWRDVEMRTTVAKDGTTTITHALGKPHKWSEWRDGYGIENGGMYVPSHVIVVVRAVPLEIAATRDELVAWVRGGEGATDA